MVERGERRKPTLDHLRRGRVFAEEALVERLELRRENGGPSSDLCAALYTADLALDYRQIWFAMRRAGYRSEEVSIYYALRRAESYGLVRRTWGARWQRPPGEQLPEAKLRQLLGARGRDFEVALERTASQLRARPRRAGDDV